MRLRQQLGFNPELYRDLPEPHGGGKIWRKAAVVHVCWPELQVWPE